VFAGSAPPLPAVPPLAFVWPPVVAPPVASVLVAPPAAGVIPPTEFAPLLLGPPPLTPPGGAVAGIPPLVDCGLEDSAPQPAKPATIASTKGRGVARVRARTPGPV
jgi:hypothetical protein